jgi:hypothetical protein
MTHAASGDRSAVIDPEAPEDGRGGSAARAIVTAALISSPFWALVAFTIYLLL